jgi:hypothetical protein
MAILPKIVIKYLVGAVLFLSAGMVFHIIFSDHYLSLSQLFNFDYERNLPTFFQTILWVLSGILCLRLSRHELDLKVQWVGAGLIALFLGADEYLAIHDQLNVPLRAMFDLKGVFFYGWVLVYGALLIALLPFALRFVSRLPRNLCVQFVMSGFIFVLGAFGVELLGGYWASNQWSQTNYVYITTLEESLEILGQCLFFYFLYKYVFRHHRQSAFQYSRLVYFWSFCLICTVLISLNRFGYY